MGRGVAHGGHAIVPAWPPLTRTDSIVAKAWFDDDSQSPKATSNAVAAEPASSPLPPPRVVAPVSVGDDRVWVSGVVPGARVVLRQKLEVDSRLPQGLPGFHLPAVTQVLAAADLAEPWTAVDVDIPVGAGWQVQVEANSTGRARSPSGSGRRADPSWTGSTVLGWSKRRPS